MPYIPKDWIINKDNESLIHDILNEYMSSDLNFDSNLVIEELKKIGETIIVDKVVNNVITFG